MKNPLVFSILLVFLVSPRSGGAVIDTFSGIRQIAATGDPLASPNSSISNNPGDFEDRTFIISHGGGRMETTLEGPGLNYSFLSEMATGSNKLGYFTYGSSSADAVNLMGEGEGVLRFQFSNLVLLREISFQVDVSSGTGSDSVQVWLPAGTRDGEFLDVPFSRFDGVDFSQVDQIRLSGWRFDSGTSFVLDSITTVPEPATLWLVMLGGLGILRRRR